MNNISASKVLMSHLPEIKDGAYKTATEIAIETLLSQGMIDWENYYSSNSYLDLLDYLELTQEQYKYWLMGKRNEIKVSGIE